MLLGPGPLLHYHQIVTAILTQQSEKNSVAVVTTEITVIFNLKLSCSLLSYVSYGPSAPLFIIIVITWQSYKWAIVLSFSLLAVLKSFTILSKTWVPLSQVTSPALVEF